MLEFFRKYQKYFFYVITVVIIMSFSFFGSISSLNNGMPKEQIAFRDVNGTAVTKHQLEEMVAFLSTDSQDKVLFGGIWGPNFLNDGVIRKDFLETGLAAVLASQYADEVNKDLSTKSEKEKRYELYVHPEAPFITTESVWNYFLPGMKQHYMTLRSTAQPASSDAFLARVQLYLGEKQLPPHLLRQVLRYQEKQYAWLNPDPTLDQRDLSLFGYHTTEEWFGPRFMRLISEFIINAAAMAEKNGYQVTKTEALADLVLNSERSFQENSQSPHLGVANRSEYFEEQLRRLGMDKNKASNLWRQVLLFRRFFNDVGSSVLVDPLSFEKFAGYTSDSVEGTLFTLPQALQISNYRALQKFQTYLEGVSKTQGDLSTLPTQFVPVQDLLKSNPEFVQKRYLLEIAHVNKKNLQTKVGIKESWNWEVDEKNWEKLKANFPELGIKNGATKEERYAALDSLDNKTRARVDAFARNAIVEEHQEWIDEALSSAPVQKEIVKMQEKGGKSPFTGLENNQELIALLDQAPLKTGDSDQHLKDLAAFSADHQNYYRISVLDRTPYEILTFEEADQSGALDLLVDRNLEQYYQKNRDALFKEFQRNDGTWKPYAEVKEGVADRYFKKTLKEIAKAYAASTKGNPDQELIGDFAASHRLVPYVRKVQDEIKKNPNSELNFIKNSEEQKSENKLSQREPLGEQWKLIRSDFKTTRSAPQSSIDFTEAYAISENSWTPIHAQPNGEISFFYVKAKGNELDQKLVADKVSEVKQQLSFEVRQKLMESLLEKIQNAGAMTLDYMNPAND